MKRTERDSIPTLRNVRLDAGLSAKDIAIITGMTAPAISRLERQAPNPRASTLARYFAACGRDDVVDVLMTLIPAADRAAVNDIRRYRAKHLA